ncbi:MAG: helix-turn-helix transcriptional regulator [Holosporaceae bacterium]|jgi:DNA-binding XRE family transcriptional regulator|nr:helix-turn-helix transcriptional regulator [Holosporaceae bacterium]
MERFKIEPDNSGAWICTDTKNQIFCHFENGKFNETQKTRFTQQEDFQVLARYCREMSDWLKANHYEKVFNDGYAERIKFCKKISTIRKEKGLTQEQLALKINMKPNNLSRIESGRNMPGLGILIKIANALGYEVDFVKSTSADGIC